MKERVSATIDGKTKKLIDSILRSSSYRNRSHIIEDSIKLLWRAMNDKNKK